MVRIYGGRDVLEHVPGDIYPRASEVFNGCLMGFNMFSFSLIGCVYLAISSGVFLMSMMQEAAPAL